MIFHLIDFSVVAAWIFYRRQQTQQDTPKRDQLDSLDFRRRIAEHLVYSSTTPAVAIYQQIDDTSEDEEVVDPPP